MRVKLGLEGAADMRAALRELPKVTRRAALRRILKKAIEPLAEAVQRNAPYRFGDLRENLTVGTKLTRRQRSMNRDERGTVLHFGTADPAGMMNEFGTRKQGPQPFFRSEWEGRKWSILEAIKRLLWDEIMSSVARFRRKAERRRSR